MSTSTRSATVYVLLAALLWSLGGIGVKVATGDAMALAGYRSAFALPILVIAATHEARRRQVSVTAMLRRPLVWAAALSYALMVVTFVVSARLTTAANAILLQYSGPIYVALLSWPLLAERIRVSDWLATIGCFLGMILFFFGKISPEGMRGNLFAILSSFGFAGVPLMMRLEQRRQPVGWRAEAASPFVAMTLGNVIAVVVCLPWMLSDPMQDRASWASVAGMGVVQIGAAYWLYGAAVGQMPALRSTLLATIEPVLNPLWVAIFKGEQPTRWAVAGGAVILVAVTGQALAARTRSRQDPRAESGGG